MNGRIALQESKERSSTNGGEKLPCWWSVTSVLVENNFSIEGA